MSDPTPLTQDELSMLLDDIHPARKPLFLRMIANSAVRYQEIRSQLTAAEAEASEYESLADQFMRRAFAAESALATTRSALERERSEAGLHDLHQRWLAFTTSPECVTGTPSWINLDDANRIVREWLAALDREGEGDG